VLTAVAAIILTFYSFDAFLEAFNYAMTLILLSLTEQPLYLVLLLKNMGFPKRWPGLWRKVVNGAAFAFLVTRVVVMCLLVRLIAFNLNATNQSVQETSLSGWWVSKYNLNQNSVTIVMIVIVVGILGSNLAVFFALHHMKGSINNKRKQKQQSQGMGDKDFETKEYIADADADADADPQVKIDLENQKNTTTSILENASKRASVTFRIMSSTRRMKNTTTSILGNASRRASVTFRKMSSTRRISDYDILDREGSSRMLMPQQRKKQ
jgi:hypothetical protein